MAMDNALLIKRKKLIIKMSVGLVCFGLLTMLYFLFWGSVEETDDAYVNGNQVPVTSRIEGTVLSIKAEDTQWVKQGEPLISLDSTDALLKVESAKHHLAQSIREVQQLFLSAKEADSVTAQRKAELQRATEDYERRVKLLKDKLVSPEDVSHLKNVAEVAKAALDSAIKQAEVAHALINNATPVSHPQWLQAVVEFKQAYIEHKRTMLYAPVSGQVANRSAQVGMHITAGIPLLSIVPVEEMWIDANFKETQIKNMTVGQLVTIQVDMYNNTGKYQGRVAGIGAGTGSAFAVIPPQNASGNWIKVVQRVPVRIEFAREDLIKKPLRIGLSTRVSIDTKQKILQSQVTPPLYQTTIFDEKLTETEMENIIQEILDQNLVLSCNRN